MSKSQRIRQAFSNLSELRNPMITGRQPINKKYLMQGKKAVKAAIKAGKKTGEPFSKSQLADIAMQKTDIPEIAANKRGGGKTLPPELGPSDRQIATKKALMRQADSTDYARAGLRALFETVLDEANKREMQRQANKAYWAGEGKPFKGAGRKLANLTKKFQAEQGEKSLFRTPDPNDPSDWGIDPIPAENVNVKPKRTRPEPDKSEEKLRSPHIN